MTIRERLKSQRGATRLGFVDILTVLVLLGILLFASYLQFPAYQRQAQLVSPAPAAPSPAQK
jgi:hypothetical protein